MFTNEDLEWQVQADRSIEEQEDLGFFDSQFDGDPKISAQKSVEDVNISDSVIRPMHMLEISKENVPEKPEKNLGLLGKALKSARRSIKKSKEAKTQDPAIGRSSKRERERKVSLPSAHRQDSLPRFMRQASRKLSSARKGNCDNNSKIQPDESGLTQKVSLSNHHKFFNPPLKH